MSFTECHSELQLVDNSFLGGLSPLNQTGSISLIERVKEKLRENTRKLLCLPLTQNQTLPDTLCEDTFFGLPVIVRSLIELHHGITQLYDWQKECLSLPALSQRKNLIYSLPTSGGKTLVAEILAFKEILSSRKSVLFILPYVSIVQEKVRSMSSFGVDLNFLVEEYAGSRGALPPPKRKQRCAVYFATIEKAHFLVDSLIEQNRLSEIGLLVVDELHMLGAGSSRGAILESTLVKVKHISPQTQIVGMSATIGNMDDLASFLSAEVFVGSFRPGKCEEEPFRLVRKLPKKAQMQDPEQLSLLVAETVPQHSCLVFCPTKQNCESVALLLARFLPQSLLDHKREQKEALLQTLRAELGQVCRVLRQTLPMGVAYHHSGLTVEERRIVEDAYTSGVLCCLTCTSTLAAGVNLPAKRVILKSPYTGTEFLTRSVYQQMAGRAGRAGMDSSGESILIVPNTDKEKVRKLLEAPVDSCYSNLLQDEQKALKMLLLSLIGLEVAKTEDSLSRVMEATLLALQQRKEGKDPLQTLRQALDDLSTAGLVLKHNSSGELRATPLGCAAFKGFVDPAMADTLRQELWAALSSLSLRCPLHLLHLVTPRQLPNTRLDPPTYYRLYGDLKENELQVAELIGISEALVTKLASGGSLKIGEQQLLQGFYKTMQLNDLWHQKSVWEVAAKYKEHRGQVQTLLASASTFASALTHFCKELPELWAYRVLLPEFTEHLSNCVTMELIPLMELPSVRKGRARQLHKAGFRSIMDVACADPKELAEKVGPISRRQSRQIVDAAKLLLLKKAEDLQEQAEQVLQGMV
ncbi:mutagen-sensitive 301 isoform X2 [Rhipicephalus microplus]|uniref:mutagen-sensitive 301 isoform X2 n=1 Tax=Rhipicephalus microplus TaxID=6941 RepID=UPI003F6B9E75